MAKIVVVVRSDMGDLGVHPKHGALIPGGKITIEEEDFGAQLFERPGPDYLSPHEKADLARAGELKQRVGDQEPPEEPEEGKPAGDLGSQAAPEIPAEKANNTEEVADHA